ncbi:nodulation protein NodH [Alphaproteobacteria bacterium KMM 3653]|uniref:Nodulation protein NodH n=1 Tax=Harenicola maris TaxID=2841044 RepID=A0AAP2CND9_9RHOB|nr:nodulation protein NodH [Harenicola maris]
MSNFDYFVLFAEMRTGSNFLEENINAFDGLTCYGEAYNPHFLGHHNQTDLFGVTMEEREINPITLIDKMVSNTQGLPGFRLFHDHDARVAEAALINPRCAKIILTRNPVESYVSLKIAGQTGQWRLTDAKNKKSARVRFDITEFEEMLANIQGFQALIQNVLQTTGQTAFYISYSDINDLSVLNGLAKFLGSTDQMEEVSDRLKPQNPSRIEDKVTNYDEMQAALAAMDRFDLSRTPNFEPRRGAAVPNYLAASDAGLLYMPIPGTPVAQVTDWLTRLEQDELLGGFDQKSLRQWKRKTKGFRSFATVTHPLLRAHRAFTRHILPLKGEQAFTQIRRTLAKAYKVPLPDQIDDLDIEAHRAAFLGFLRFLKANLAGQTSIRLDGSWASQTTILQGMADFAMPDVILREETLEADLVALCGLANLNDVPELTEPEAEPGPALSELVTEDIEKAAMEAYQRDFLNFGYKRGL